MNKKIVLKNITWVTLSGYYSIFVSLIKNFFFAYVLTTNDYANVQSYILYQGYSWILLFGFADGIFINYARYDYNDIPIKKFRAFSKVIFIIQASMMITLIIWSTTTERPFIIINVAIGILTVNISVWLSAISRFTCRFKIDSLGLMVWNTTFLICIITMGISGCYNDTFAIIGLTMANITYAVFMVYNNIGIIWGESDSVFSVLPEMWATVKIGLLVTVSVAIGQVIMSIDKVFVDNLFTTSEFANYAFATSVMALLFNVVNSSSKVVFPYLARIDREKAGAIYTVSSSLITVIAALLCSSYFIIVPMIKLIIPKYTESLAYISILFPCLIFKIVFNVINDNFFKYMGRVKEYTINGSIALFMAITLNLIGVTFFKTVSAIAYASVITFLIWHILNESFFVRQFHLPFAECAKKYIVLCVALALFGFCINLPLLSGAVIYIVIVLSISGFLFKDRLCAAIAHLRKK